MSFSVGILDALFGEKITIEIPDCFGNIVTRSVSRKWFEKLLNEDCRSTAGKQVAKVHMLDAGSGYRVLFWLVGDDVDEFTACRLRDPDSGAFYAIHYFEQDESKTEIIDRENWEFARGKFMS
ncbi:MAG: hypothetical protein CVU89_08680 [Firmicutes bacterium HGW-Firmicutes-14]|nr:MAG: hypothetical protein CVU89_08680 [Firmicutes bacterium HGW-Firmicutes-14]